MKLSAPPDKATVLIVDDEADIRELLELTLNRMGLATDSVESVREAQQRLKSKRYNLCLTDMRLPDGNGLELVKYIDTHLEDLPVAVITAYGSTENAVAALKSGAFDYLTKPLGLDALRSLVEAALNLPQKPGDASGQKEQNETLFGQSPSIEQARLMINKLSRSQAPVYITGESGCGKELAARLIHKNGARRDKPFVAVNCGAIPENLMESEFFGYKRGAFTGADKDREGFFQAAHTGTLFLDEVADLPLAMQVKLLRAIQEKKVRKIGATTEDPIDVRIICATHQNLANCVETGKFRQDLYYRLNVIELKMPALRECQQDIPILANAFMEKLEKQHGNTVPTLSADALQTLSTYHFPGNVRELENILERAVALCTTNQITIQDLQLPTSFPPELSKPQTLFSGIKTPLTEYLDRLEKEAILEALHQTQFNRTAAAKLLGVSFRSLRYRMQRLGINEDFKNEA